MSIAPLVFTGVSTFSTDFQSIMTRAVQIANLPVTALTNKQADIQQEKMLAANLNSAISNLSTSLGSLAALGKTQGMVALSTDSSKVTANATGVTSATYSIANITSIARAASETSLSGYAGQQYSSTYTALTGPAPQSLTFTLNDALGVPQTKVVNLAAGLDAAGAATAINTALAGSPALTGITAAAGAGAISFSGSSSSSFTVAFGDVTTGGGFAVDKNSTMTSAATQVSATGTLQLTLGGVTTPIVLGVGKNNLAGLADAINNLNLGVTASVLNTGTGATPNYLSLSANQTGLTTLTLQDGATNLVTATNQGADTIFKLNGLDVTKHSTVVADVVPGVSFTFNGTTTVGQTVTVSLASDRSKISSALQDLVAKYNLASGQVNSQIGPAAGLLSGNSMIGQARQSMFSLSNSSGSGSNVQSFADLGIEMSNSGVMSFNSDTFNALSSNQITDAYGFLGTATAGPTAMQARFKQLTDPVTGAIKAQQDQWDATDKRITKQVDDLTARISAMQLTLQSKLQTADSLLASLASQQSILTSSIQSMNFTSYGYQNTAPVKQS
ncbi:MAG: flagellar filament capping protein FliD [Candidatus Solibacter sp.]